MSWKRESGLVVLLAASGSCLRRRAPRRTSRRRSRPPGSTSGRTTTAGWSQSHDAAARGAESARSKVKTTYKENVPEGPQVVSGHREPDPRRQQDDLRDLVRLPGVRWSRLRRSTRTSTSRWRPGRRSKNLAEYFGAERGLDLPVGMAAGAATKKGVIGYIVPYPIPEVIRHANAFALGAQAMRPNVRVRLVWTHSWFDVEEGATGGGEPRRRGRRRPRPERGQRRRRPVRGVEEDPVGRYDADARKFAADLVAHRGRVRLGRLLRPARQGRDERHVEDRLLLRDDQGRVHRPRSVRPEGHGEDEGGDQGEKGAADLGQVLRVHRPAVRPEGQAPRPEGRSG